MESLGANFRAVVVGATGGIGRAFHSALDQNPNCAKVHGLSRQDGLDLSDEQSIETAAEDIPEYSIDLLIVATGALSSGEQQPEKTIRHIDPAAMLEQFAINAVGPALVLKHFAPKLPRDRRSIVAVLSARVGSIGDNRLGGWISYRSSKAALNQIVRTTAIEVARTRPEAVIVALHPGTVATSFSERFSGGRQRLAPEDSARSMLSVLDGIGVDISGGFFAYDGKPIGW